MISILIILINRKNQEFFIYLSAPAIVSGVIILFLTLFIDKGINLLNIDSISFNKLINNFIQISNISSILIHSQGNFLQYYNTIYTIVYKIN